MTVGVGSKTLATQAGKAWVVGAFVYLVSAASVSNFMVGQVTAYNTVTGQLTVNVNATAGAGTLASWIIGLSVPQGSTAVYSGYVSAAGFQLDSLSSLYVSGSVAYWVLDSGDSLYFDRSTNILNVTIGGVGRFHVDANDGPCRLTDASTGNGLVRRSQMDSAILSALPIGAIIDWPSETPPAGWLENDGSSLLRAGFYAPLYAVLGTAHGAADATHFNLPDHRGKFKRGWAHGTSNDPDRATRGANAPGGATGDHVGTTQGWQIESHSHTQAIFTIDGPNTNFPTGNGGGGMGTSTPLSYYGGNQTNPINAAVMSIIKVA
ncbi:phage tail protein [Aquabacterium sp.]|uniref:phage tail protein n=1 Tax=Aquabacterium sp. TaxID=1872578 RepID=UPI0025C481DD|nr:phage tail protein [Aquabacterium sp.]